jgi:hypothetical protein
MALDIEMNKIAFDLDGVFIPDCDPIPNVGGLGEFLSMTVYMKPMFKPNFEWHIITGRPARYRATTIDWINKHFTNKPMQVWHECLEELPQVYKENMINQNGITIFVESDIEQVRHLQKHTRAEVIHFDTFLASNLAISSLT